MNNSTLSSKSASAGFFAAIVASLCCITPVFSFLAGIGGIAATFSWMEPFRPYLIALTIGVLGFAWYIKLKPSKNEIDCDCDDEKPSFLQSKKFLSVITVFAGLMLSFPSYAHIFYPSNPGSSSPESAMVLDQDTTKTNKIILNVNGMTCAGCETHIVTELNKLKGVKSVFASYADGTATIEFSQDSLTQRDIVMAIDKTGYKVIDKPENKD
ncbi:mercuric transport protein MerTP [Ekhidna sp.]|uniref:mercuric transport protein MerTP n=1 Tax=Ekhidna sp. TaxID=2608089 RepID=UPI003299329E